MKKLLCYISMLFIVIFLIFLLPGCSDENDCYNAEMESNHPGVCTQDCPGVCGCDGNTYCNTCIANSQGIEVVREGPCN